MLSFEWHIDFDRDDIPGTTYFRLLGKGRIVSNSSDCNYSSTSDWQAQCGGNDIIIFKISENEPFSIEFYSVSAEGHTETVQTRVLQ